MIKYLKKKFYAANIDRIFCGCHAELIR